MKNILYLLVIGSLLSISCTKTSNTKEYTCSFEGEPQDIKHFLGLEEGVKNKDIRMQRFANQYMFTNKEEPLMIYGFDETTNIFETLKLNAISTQLKRDRKYKMQILDSTDRGFQLKITSGDKTFTPMKGKSIIIDCFNNPSKFVASRNKDSKNRCQEYLSELKFLKEYHNNTKDTTYLITNINTKIDSIEALTGIKAVNQGDWAGKHEVIIKTSKLGKIGLKRIVNNKNH
ncbi:hypothetical protein [Aquimarina litoralis]|uniref:hypothetical protein n=1 Tax=Aquimarina litoralis TaxID=584605 RepID=UPI001C574B15|nr:hypothetical protein [Aquimarina litoralis]MBW1295232.1 hypothetical protein [Aquimarina litoralis]